MDDVEYLVALQEAIAALPPDQRQQVLSSVGKDVATNGKRETLSFDEEVLWDALNKVSMSSQTPFEFRASYGVKRWKARLAFLHRFLAEERAALNQPQFAGLVLVCLRCLADWLQQLPKAPPIVARVLLNNFDYLPAAVDIGFPGYKNAGRLAKVAQLMLPGERR